VSHPSASTKRGADALPPLSVRGWLRFDVVRRVLSDLRPRTALEIGCGQGAFGARLATVTSYVGVEPDDESFSVAHERITARGGEVLHGLHTVVPAGSVYDTVCAFEVLEHLEDDVSALTDWVELVRPGGHLVLSVPAFQEKFGAWDTYAGHFRRYSPDEISQLLIAAGLVDVEVTLYGWPICYPTESLRNRIAERKLARIDDRSPAAMTAKSGRRFQPNTRTTGRLIAAAVAPFRLLQRARPQNGTGLVAVARKRS
jgi:2-polyprenyl-3-methyl-5-hydroxy-6-metoxy-1,4-benzoquinol methylase